MTMKTAARFLVLLLLVFIGVIFVLPFLYGFFIQPLLT